MTLEGNKNASSDIQDVSRVSWRAHSVLVGQVLGIFLLLLPIFGYSVWSEWEHGLSTQTEEIVMRANSLAARQTTLAASTRSLLISMSLTPDVRSGNSKTIYTYFKKVGQIQQDYNGFAFFNMQGETVAMVYNGEPRVVAPETVRTRVYFQEALAAQGFNVSMPMLLGNDFVLPMTLPVTNEAGERIGMLTAMLSLSRQSDVVRHIMNDTSYSVSFYDASYNTVLGISDIDAHKAAMEKISAQSMTEFFLKNAYVYTEDDTLHPRTFEMAMRNQNFIGTVVSLKNDEGVPYFYIVVIANQIDFSGFINNRYAWQIVIMIMLVVLTLCIAVAIGRKCFTYGLEKLEIVAIRSQDGDFKVRCGKVLGCREIQVLSVSFDTMLDELESKRNTLLSLSQTDPLTGIWNRRHFMDIGEFQCQTARRYGHPIALVMGDIDFFKKVNDTYGHAAGDAVLQHFVKTLAENLRAADILARYGGEEFIMLLPDTDKEGAAALVERIRHAVEASSCVTQEGYTVSITASFGVAVYATEALVLAETGEIAETAEIVEAPTLASLQAKADAALYESKANGRNRVTFA